MTFSRYLRFRPAFLHSERLTFKNNCVKSNKYSHVLSQAEM